MHESWVCNLKLLTIRSSLTWLNQQLSHCKIFSNLLPRCGSCFTTPYITHTKYNAFILITRSLFFTHKHFTRYWSTNNHFLSVYEVWLSDKEFRECRSRNNPEQCRPHIFFSLFVSITNNDERTFQNVYDAIGTILNAFL